MKKLFILSILMLPAGGAYAVPALKCMIVTCPTNNSSIEANPYSTHCTSRTNTCYQNAAGQIFLLTACTACSGGYKLTNASYTSTVCESSFAYNNCDVDCPSCSNCISDTTWSSAGTGYEKKVSRTCNCGTCTSSTSYRCAAGYYGSSSNGTSGCSRCPSSGGVYGTSAAGSTAITSCYLPSGTTVSFSDSIGSGTAKYTSNCYYSN